MRESIVKAAMVSVPSIDYAALMAPILQGVFYKHMPAEVRAVHENEETREYLKNFTITLREGNGYGGRSMDFSEKDTRGRYAGYYQFYGLVTTNHLNLRMSEEYIKNLKKGTLTYDLTRAVQKSGYFDKHLAQNDLVDSVRRRLQATVASVNTVKRLYDVLEPELHHLIPKEDDKVANLPATVAPVVSDLKKLGAVLPTVPKRKK